MDTLAKLVIYNEDKHKQISINLSNDEINIISSLLKDKYKEYKENIEVLEEILKIKNEDIIENEYKWQKNCNEFLQKRIDLDLTRGQVAKITGLSNTTIKNLEERSYVHKPNDNTLRKYNKLNDNAKILKELDKLNTRDKNKHLGNKLKKIRISKLLSLRQVAEKLGYTKQYLSLLETGKTAVSDDQYRQIKYFYESI